MSHETNKMKTNFNLSCESVHGSMYSHVPSQFYCVCQVLYKLVSKHHFYVERNFIIHCAREARKKTEEKHEYVA